MMKIADITPVFFSPLKETFAREVDYRQFFHQNDRIELQVFSDEGAPEGHVFGLSSGASTPIAFSTYAVNDGVTLYYASLTGLQAGDYRIAVNSMESEVFSVYGCDLPGTALLRFSHKDNNGPFDNIFWVGDTQRFIEFRVEGGFKPEDTAYEIEYESFRNQYQELTYLYAVPYEVRKLTVGTSHGVPEWFARFLCRAFCLSYAEVDGELFRLSEGNAPEKTQTLEGSQLYTVKVSVEPARNDIAGMGGTRQPGSAGMGGNAYFEIKGAKDGEMLVFDGRRNAFVNEGVIR